MHCLALTLLVATTPELPIDTLTISGNVDATVKRGDAYAIEADPRLLIEVKDNALRIRNVPGDTPTTAPRVTITLPRLLRLEVSGVVRTMLDNLRGDALAIQISGASTVMGNGEVKTLTVAASGAATVDLEHVISSDATLAVTGTGSVKVLARDRLTAQVSGAAKVGYWGAPRQVTRSISGAAELIAH